jgi:class 3 adenylate cyclase
VAEPREEARDQAREVLRLERRVRRLEEMLSQVESIRDTNAHLLDRLMRDLDVERQRSRELLLNVLPEAIVARLDAGETLIADTHERVAVLFSDFVGFTDRSSQMSAEEVVNQLNALFRAFDAACVARGVEKIKTIGDAYMAAAGLDDGSAIDPIGSTAELALDMLDAVERTDGTWQIRIGIHAGPAAAGVIGTRKFAYDLWGDTVNVASRLETTCAPNRIQVSEVIAQSIGDRFRLEPRGQVELKGKGSVATWYLDGRT